MSSTKITKITKIITLTAQATESHNQVKVNSILKWLKSGHDVRVSIKGRSDRQKQMESVFQKIERESRPGSRVLQKIVKPESIKFTLNPNEGAANIVINDIVRHDKAEENDVESLYVDKDLFSDDFEKELDESIKDEIAKNKKR